MLIIEICLDAPIMAIDVFTVENLKNAERNYDSSRFTNLPTPLMLRNIADLMRWSYRYVSHFTVAFQCYRIPSHAINSILFQFIFTSIFIQACYVVEG